MLWCSGASPYPGIAAEQLCHMLKSGYRMDKPTACSDQLYVQRSLIIFIHQPRLTPGHTGQHLRPILSTVSVETCRLWQSSFYGPSKWPDSRRRIANKWTVNKYGLFRSICLERCRITLTVDNVEAQHDICRVVLANTGQQLNMSPVSVWLVHPTFVVGVCLRIKIH